MATLEKIRKRSVLLFIVIIGALLAFILGDFINSGRSFTGPGDTVAKGKGVKVDYRAFQERAKTAAENAKNNPQTANMDNQIIEEQVIEQLMLEQLLNSEYDNLGITVTDAQISKIFFDPQYAPNTFQQLLSQFGQQGASALYQSGIVDTRAYADAMKNPAKYKLTAEEGQILTQVWQSMENNMDQQLKQGAFMQLISGLFNASEVDAKALYNERNTTTHFTYVRKDINTVNDKDVKLTEEDYQKYYDEHKGMFKLTEEARAVKAIVVPIQPSTADYEAGAKENNQLFAELQTSEGTDALKAHRNFAGKTGKYTAAALKEDAQLRALAADSTGAGLAVGTVKQLPAAPGSYAIAKVTGQSTGIDKVTFSTVTVPAESDSVFTSLTAASFDSIATQLGGQTAIELSLVNPAVQLTPKQISALTDNQVGEIFFLNDTIEGTEASGAQVKQATKSAFLITKRDQPQTIYDITRADYTVIPSTATINDLNQKLHAYVANNGTAETFVANAEKSGYNVMDAMVSNSTPLVGNSRGSRNAVKWAMDNSKGKVSHVFNQTSDDYLMAVAVTEIFNGDYLPLSSELVREQIKPYVTAQKKADMLIAKYQGKKDLAGYAQAMGETVANGESVFADQSVPGVGFGLGALQGVVAGTKAGAVSAPFLSGTAVYVIQAGKSDTNGRPYNFKEDAQNYQQKTLGAMLGSNQAMLRTLLGNEKFTNNILEFTSAE